jgi:spermidine/putrescine transport system ATP-binding protein
VGAVLELQSLTKQFATHRAVDSVSLALREGEFFSLVGPSGCGKTTTLRMVAGLDSPTSGDVLLNGQSMLALPPHKRDVNTVFQNYALFPHLTVAQNIAFGLERRGAGKSSIAAKVTHAVSLMQLTGKETRLPNQLSGGERQRVALARALVLEPKVLLLDEPLSALDPQLRKQMRLELKALQQRVGITFLFITHDQEEALSVSDRIGVMQAGRLQQTGTARELYRKPNSRFVAEFLGEVSYLNGAALRPESLRLWQQGAEDKSVPATIIDTCFLGSRAQVNTRLANGATCLIEMNDGSYHPGDRVEIWWHPADQLPLGDE